MLVNSPTDEMVSLSLLVPERIRKASGLKMKWAERVSKAHMNQFISWPDVKDPKAVRRSIPKYRLPPKKYRF